MPARNKHSSLFWKNITAKIGKNVDVWYFISQWTEHNDIQQNNIEQNGTQHNNIQPNDILQNSTRRNDTLNNDT